MADARTDVAVPPPGSASAVDEIGREVREAGAVAAPEERDPSALLEDQLARLEQDFAWFGTTWDAIVDYLLRHSLQLLGALILLGIGYAVANRVSRLVLSLQEQRDVDVTLRRFIASVVRVGIIVAFVVIAVEQVGLSIAPFVAAIGGLALGASFALQLPVSNYGAGLVIILTRPFKVGDTIRIIDQFGIVDDINLAMTHLTNEDGEQIIIPNKHLIGEVLVNSRDNRVVEGVVRIAYGDDPRRAIGIVAGVLEGDPDVVAAPAPQVGIEAFDDSCLRLSFRYWVPTASFFEVQYRVNLAVWESIDAAGLTIPRPQRDVHLVPAPER